MAPPKETKTYLHLVAACVIFVGCFHLLLQRPHFRMVAGYPGSRLSRPHNSTQSGRHRNQLDNTTEFLREPYRNKNTSQLELDLRKNASRPVSGLRQLENTSQPVLVVIVSSSPRSGSSFLGEMLSSPRQAVLFYEPFWYCDTNGLEITKDMHLSPEKSHHGLVKVYLHNMLTCRLTSLPAMFDKSQDMEIWRKPAFLAPITLQQRTSVCRNLDLRVVKVVRPGLGSVLPLLQVPGLNVHIVQLVRDPRAIVNSVLVKDDWIKGTPPSKICNNIRGDLKAARDFKRRDLISRRYTLVRYEDLVARPVEEARRLFERMGLALPSEVTEFIDRHTRRSYSTTATQRPTTTPQPPEVNTGGLPWRLGIRKRTDKPPVEDDEEPTEPPIQPEVFTDYFGTIRDAQFDELHWLKELPKNERRTVEQVCKDVLHELEYPLLYPQESESLAEGKA